jgi:DNA-binding transcriptional ArsR family regulator
MTTGTKSNVLTDPGIDPQLAKAASHPLRMRILTILDQRVASPNEMAKELGVPLGNVSYHTRQLLELDCIELVREEKRRGALEHYYRSLHRPILPLDTFAGIPLSVRRAICDGVLNQIGKDLSGAAASGGFDRTDIHLTRTPLALDEEGWATLAKRLADLHEEALELQAESADRVAKRRTAARKGEDPSGADADTFTANLVLLLFEQAAAGRQPAPAAEPAKKPRSRRRA